MFQDHYFTFVWRQFLQRYYLLAPIVPAAALYAGFVNGTPITLTPSTPAMAFTASTGANPLTYSILSAKLKQMGQYTFTLQLADTATYTANALQYTSEFRMAVNG